MRARQVPPVRELPPGDLEELAGIPHVEVPGQLLQQPDGLVPPLLQAFHHAPQDHRELLIVQSQQLLRTAHGLAQGLAQLPGGLNVLGDEAKLVLASADPVVVLRLHRIEEPLEVLIRHAPDVFLEPPVRGVQVAITEDHLPVQGPAGVGLDGQIGDAVRVVHGDELEQTIQLHAPARQRLQLDHAVLVVGVQQQRSLARRRRWWAPPRSAPAAG